MQGILVPRLAAGRLDRFLAGHPDATTPFLVVDLDVVRRVWIDPADRSRHDVPEPGA